MTDDQEIASAGEMASEDMQKNSFRFAYEIAGQFEPSTERT